MEKSALQKARIDYAPKLPTSLQGSVKVKEGAPTQSVDDQEDIKKLFPNTYGMPVVEFEPSNETQTCEMNVGVILSGGQAPGGHNVITGVSTPTTSCTDSSSALADWLTTSILKSQKTTSTIIATLAVSI